MQGTLDGKIALVTGASRGIGAAIVRELSGAGAKVAITGREGETLKEVAASLPGDGVVTVEADVSKTADLDRLVDEVVRRLGGVDVLVNNAGILPPAKQIYEFGVDEWEHTLEVNLRAPWYLSKLVHPHMKRRGGGAIVNVSSNSGLHHDIGLGVYSISKAAVVMLTEVCAKEWARDGIRVNCVCPGTFRSAIHADLPPEALDAIAAKHPLGLGSADDLVGAYSYLAGDASRWTTGSAIVVDGGYAAP
jgi:3-oxoacyl-[acyl-carrier protein] reductase